MHQGTLPRSTPSSGACEPASRRGHRGWGPRRGRAEGGCLVPWPREAQGACLRPPSAHKCTFKFKGTWERTLGWAARWAGDKGLAEASRLPPRCILGNKLVTEPVLCFPEFCESF